MLSSYTTRPRPSVGDARALGNGGTRVGRGEVGRGVANDRPRCGNNPGNSVDDEPPGGRDRNFPPIPARVPWWAVLAVALTAAFASKSSVLIVSLTACVSLGL